jgi:branched-chain amino acid transport system substrate-binding protein
MKKAFAIFIGIDVMCLCLILAILSGMPEGAIAADTIKIGQIDAFSGPFEYAGRMYYNGIKFAVDEQNAKGGLLGKKIEIIKADSELKPDVAIRKAKKLILKEKVDFISSGVGSHVAIALNKVATGYKTILINYGGMSDIVQGKEFSRYAFRVCQNSYNFTSALAQLMAGKPYRKFYIICQDYAWGHDVAQAFKEQLKVYLPDAQIVGEDFHPLATKDFGPYITKVIAAKADAVFSGNWGPDARLLVKQARSLGLKAPYPFVMTYGLDPYTEQELGDDSVGIHWANDYTLRVNTPENQAMIAKFHARPGHKNSKDVIDWWPTGSTGHAILGWQMFFAAVEEAGSLDPEKIINAFEGFRYKTAVGWWTMRECDHQVILPMFGGVVEAGENPYFNGSILPDKKFPWLGPDIMTFSAEESAIPPTGDYNKRCP